MKWTRDSYVMVVADLFSRDRNQRERERKVREANRLLYRALVNTKASDAQADLALARAVHGESNDK